MTINPLNLIKSLIRWAVISGFSDDNTPFPVHKMEYMGRVADAVAWYPFGYHANPGANTLSLILAVNGDFENRVSLPGSPKERLDPLMPTPLAEGEVIMYHPATKSYIHFKADGDIEINSQKDVNVRVVGNALLDVEGNLTVDVEGAIVETAEANVTKVVTGGNDTVTADTIQRTANTEFNVDAPKIIIGDGSDDILLILADFIAIVDDNHFGGSWEGLAALTTRANNMRT